MRYDEVKAFMKIAFFFVFSGDAGYLHSFPTRRSSDLLMHACSATKRCGRAAAGNCNQRSEEHTSELQSRGHLVCRLLLEKKKKNDWNNGTAFTASSVPNHAI